MGGDHHHVKIPKVPDASIYKVDETVPYFFKVQQRLAAKGLKDPWLRNHVWRAHIAKDIKRPQQVLLPYFIHGWKIWVPLVALTIGVEHFLGIDYHGHSHSHDDHHKEDSH